MSGRNHLKAAASTSVGKDSNDVDFGMPGEQQTVALDYSAFG
jgi:hypothetical protein